MALAAEDDAAIILQITVGQRALLRLTVGGDAPDAALPEVAQRLDQAR